MNYKAYFAELLGTFTLTFVVWLGTAYTMPLTPPVAAAITLGLFVYTIGTISGSHINPAVTIALLSVNKIKAKDAGLYIVAQVIGAGIAMLLGAQFTKGVAMGSDISLLEGIGEILGSFVFIFGIASVVNKGVHEAVRGLVVGGSLLLGIYIASAFSNGILNPAVAWGVGSFNPMYLLGPVIGGVAAVWAHQWMTSK